MGEQMDPSLKALNKLYEGRPRDGVIVLVHNPSLRQLHARHTNSNTHKHIHTRYATKNYNHVLQNEMT